MTHYGRALLLVILSSSLITACGEKKDGAATQIAAKVNDHEISVHQINYAMARLGNIPKGKEDEAGKQVLRELVDQQLLVQQALDKRLDRSPNVLQALEVSKRQILTQAYIEQMAEQLAKPTDAEIHDYYVKTPELFSSRRIYKFAEISMAGSTSVETVKQMLSGEKNLDGFVGKLRKENIEFRTFSSVKAAEELPLEMLPKFFQMAKGEVALIPMGDKLIVLQLQDSKEQPLTEEQAKPAIANFMFADKRRMLIEAEMKKLRDSGKIEYLGAYADLAKNEQAAPAQPATPAPSKKEDHLEKGISGLK